MLQAMHFFFFFYNLEQSVGLVGLSSLQEGAVIQGKLTAPPPRGCSYQAWMQSQEKEKKNTFPLWNVKAAGLSRAVTFSESTIAPNELGEATGN